MTLFRRAGLVSLIVLLLTGGTVYLWWSRMDDLPRVHGFVYPTPKVISLFQLTDHTGTPFTNDSLRGRWSLLFFGYTHCPDVCPATLGILSQTQARLQQQGLDDGNQYVFVSVDPGRDSAQLLGDYLKFYNHKFTGVTGDEKSLSTLSSDVGALYSFPNGKAGAQYAVVHSSNIYLFDPQARLCAVFNSPHEANLIAADFIAVRTWWNAIKAKI